MNHEQTIEILNWDWQSMYGLGKIEQEVGEEESYSTSNILRTPT